MQVHVEEHQIRHVPWKAWLFKCLHILNITSNSLKMRPDFYATCLCCPIYIFLCTVLVTLPRLGHISYHFDDSRILQYTQILHNATWSTLFDLFHTVSFTIQSHDQNQTLPLKWPIALQMDVRVKWSIVRSRTIKQKRQVSSIHRTM